MKRFAENGKLMNLNWHSKDPQSRPRSQRVTSPSQMKHSSSKKRKMLCVRQHQQKQQTD
jgi:hypothetical protein